MSDSVDLDFFSPFFSFFFSILFSPKQKLLQSFGKMFFGSFFFLEGWTQNVLWKLFIFGGVDTGGDVIVIYIIYPQKVVASCTVS